MAINYGQVFAASTTWTVPGTTHNLGHPWLRVQIWDAGSPRRRLRPGTLSIDPTTYTVTATFLQAQAGLIVIGGAAPLSGPQGNLLFVFPAQSTWIVSGVQHRYGTDHLLIDAYDNSLPHVWLPLADVQVDPVTFDVLVSWAPPQAGSLVISGYADVGTPNVHIPLSSNPQTVPGSVHGLGTAALGVQMYDNQVPMREVLPGSVTVDPTSYTVTVSVAQAQTGTVVLGGSLAHADVGPPVSIPAPLPVPLSQVATDVLARMLRRLPVSLWDTDAASNTLQRDLFGAMAAQTGVWLEQRGIANQMTLLKQAEGIDLDVLLQDYGLRRYLQRPDAFARQVAEHIVFRPRCTLYAVDALATLLFDPPHHTLRTGRSEAAVLIAEAQPVTVPYSYIGLVSPGGLWSAVSVETEMATVTPNPPPGLNIAPAPHTLTWFTALDEHSATWYVTVWGESLTMSQTQPQGYGTTTPLSVQDGHGTLWGFSVNSQEEVLITTALSAGHDPLTALLPSNPFQALQLLDPSMVRWWFTVQGAMVRLSTTQPAGAQDITAPGGPYSWLGVSDLLGRHWYAWPSTSGTMHVAQTPPSGLGTMMPQTLGDEVGRLWHWGVTATQAFAISNTPSVTFAGAATTVCLNDPQGQRWFWRVSDGRLDWGNAQWPDTIDQSPWGEIGWLTVPVSGGSVYASPSTSGTPVAAVAPPLTSYWGWFQPVFFWDTQGVQWQLTATPVLPGHPDYWRLLDEYGSLWYLWMDAEVITLTTTLPPGGSDQTPTSTPLNWFVAPDALEQPWFAQVIAECLSLSTTMPPGLGTSHVAIVADTNAFLWTITASAGDEMLVTTSGPQYGLAVGGPSAASHAQGTDVPVERSSGASLPATPSLLSVLTPSPPGTDYWRLGDPSGTVYALFVDAEVLVVTTDLSTGNDKTPGNVTLGWFTARDEQATSWYASIDGDVLVLTTSLPSGVPTGTSTPLTLADTSATLWQVTVSSQEEVLITSTQAPPSDQAPPGIPSTSTFWRLLDEQSTLYAFYIDAEVGTVTPTITGGVDTTPSGGPFAWFQALDETATPWYVRVVGDSVQVTTTSPGGVGITAPASFTDSAGTVWTLTIAAQEEALFPLLPLSSGGPPLPPGAVPASATYWRLLDEHSTTYALYMDAEVPSLTTDLSSGHDTTPGGLPLPWCVVSDETNQTWYVQVIADSLTVVTTQPPGFGAFTTATLLDGSGNSWTITALVREEALLASLPPIVTQPPDPTPPGIPAGAEYWRMRDTVGTLYALYIDAEVPTITPTITGGTDVTPGGSPLNWATVVDEGNAVWYMTITGDALGVVTTQPPGTGTSAPATLRDSTGQLWSLTVHASEEALMTTTTTSVTPPPLASGVWRLGVVQVSTVHQVPAPPPLNMRDAADAIGHVQPAGSLVTILVR